MKFGRRIGLAYCQLNSDFAKAISADFKNLDIEIDPVVCDELLPGQLWEQIGTSSDPTIVLLSDNFLKSQSCIAESDTHIPDLAQIGSLFFIVIPGRYRDEVNLEYYHVPTHFGKATELLKYVTYWRQAKERASTKASEIPFEGDNSTEVAVDYSTTVMRSLTFLRNATYCFKAEDLESNDYEELIQALKLPQTDGEAVALRRVLNGENVEDLREILEDSTQESVQSNVKPKPKKKVEKLSISLGLQFEKNGEYKKAKKFYEKLIQEDAENAYPYFMLSKLYQKHLGKNVALTKHYLKKAIKLDDTNPEYHFAMGNLLYRKFAKYSKAKKCYEQAISLDENFSKAYYELSDLLKESGDKVASMGYFQKARQLEATHDESSEGESSEVINGSDPITEKESNKVKKPEFSRFKSPNPKKQTILITGASSGIGKATARRFSKKGYNVILTGRRVERLEEQRSHWEEKYGNSIYYLVFDVRDYGAASKALATLPSKWSRIDILVNNAGLAKGFDPIHLGEINDWEEMIDTNVKGLLYMTRLVSPSMVDRTSGHIINVCSIAGREVYPNGNVYCATKYAVEAITKASRLDLYKYNVRVSEVSPAHVEETEFARVRFNWDKERAKIYEEFNPLTSRDVAKAIYFIAHQPERVNIQDILMMGTQQPNANIIDRSGRKYKN